MALSDAALTDRTNALLTNFTQHSFKAHDLKAAVPLRSTNNYNSQHTENFTRFTQDATNMTGMTAQSDSGLVMDPEDKERAVEDLQGFKDFVSTLKFAYLESNIKLQFVAHITDKDGPKIISLEDNDKLEKERLQSKAELKEKKRRAGELEGLIRAEAESLDNRLQQTEQDAMTAANLLRECEAMEAEIAMLKNKRSATERITIDESLVLQDEQLNKMAQIGPKTAAATEKISATKSNIKKHKAMYEKLEGQKKEMNKEQADRELKGTRDERAEEACRWITNATALYSSLLGIRSAYALGSPPTEMIIEYERTEGDSRTLSIKFGRDGKMRDAELVHSNIDIQDLVQAYLPSQDLRALVQEVRARIVR
ncbi:hypothetical protein BCR35DRAFT_7677 [Leucosporidium creatinivorum]|uniref:Kinetochore protein Sos7 coiled-coil domain-containing protein n=1 Tax=Leucosporidium creatinivorum TaxID=106004 RepID=A0A1Y2G486_9BASI|nr:hypothetical protein BCR35DRAFT_7677 [Leucosporidium creatinivorum]